MISAPNTYSIWPSVIPADKATEMTIISNDRAFIFPDDEKYQLLIISVNSDENYYTPHSHKKLNVTAKNGVLSFSFDFSGEQEHTIFLKKDESTLATFSVYSLYEDLYELCPLKGDLHSHSCRSDGKTDAVAQAGYYREQGYDFAALTDHNRYYPGGEIDEAYQGVKTGLTRVLGEEVHCPGSVVHIVHIGGKASVAERYVNDRENYDKEIEEYISRVPTHVPDLYKERYAKAMWATDAIHTVGGLAIFPHPFWKPGHSKTYNVCDEFAKILITSGMFDAYELLGAMEQRNRNRSVAFWADLRSEGLKIPVVGSSDSHNIENGTTFPNIFTICFASENTNDSIIAAVKQGNCVAVESSSVGNVTEYRCYGSLRLVSYAQFLLANFFPKQQRLSQGSGVVMRAYAMNEASAQLVEEHATLVENFRNRFFGRCAANLPSKSIMAFEEKWRAVQLNGPRTRGSSVDATPAKALI